MSEPASESGPQFRYDPQTLREIVEEPLADQIESLRSEVATAPDEIGELAARGDLVGLLRISGDLDAALDEARAAVDRARIAGTPAQQHLAQLRLAHVHQWRSEFSQSDAIFSLLLDHISDFGPIVEAFTHHHAGLNDYDQGRYDQAAEHFAAALDLRTRMELPEADLSRQALEAAQRAGKDSE